MHIKAKRQFSHYHLGTVDAGEVRRVSDDIGAALIGMGLAEQAEPAKKSDPAEAAPVQARRRKARGVE